MITADRVVSSPPGLTEGSLADLREDFDELAHLAGSMRDRVESAGREVRGATRGFRPSTRAMVSDDLETMAARLTGFWESAMGAADDCSAEANLHALSGRKASMTESLRALLSQAAALIVSSDWQSPSFSHAGQSSAGRYEGRITEHVDDYKRDRHPDAAAFEAAFLREYVDGPLRLGLRALMTNCGMSAFTTILAFLETDRRIEGPVVAGRGTYHECLDLLARSRFADRLVLVDETNSAEILWVLDAAHPRLVFLDSLCNSKGIAVPDLRSVVAALAVRQEPAYLIIDNTGLSCSFQPYAWLPVHESSLHILLFESLTKYAQFGLDRTTAGMIVAPTEDGVDLDARREHLGTNVTDTSVGVIPWPDRMRLERRLRRLGRNAELLAQRLQLVAERPGSPLRSVTHPGLLFHPSRQVIADTGFRGGFLSLELDTRSAHGEARSAFLRLALEEAERRGVSLAAGASFGLNTTRIYVTASNSDPARGFIRISPGTEHHLQVEALGDVFESALDRLGSQAVIPSGA